MIVFDKKIWKTHDPDGVLLLDKESFELKTLKFLGDIHPREDLIFFDHTQTNKIVDYGYYGSEVALDGEWVVYVIDGNIEEAWEVPIERYSFPFGDFLKGIDCVQSMVQKYT